MDYFEFAKDMHRPAMNFLFCDECYCSGGHEVGCPREETPQEFCLGCRRWLEECCFREDMEETLCDTCYSVALKKGGGK